MKTDPISGRDVEDCMNHCSLLDGNLTIYLETEEIAWRTRPFPSIILTCICHFPLPRMMTVAADGLEVFVKVR